MSNKLIRILAIVSAVLMLVALLGLAGCILLQRPIAEIFHLNYSAVRRNFIIPLGMALYALGMLVSAAFLCVSAGSNKLGIWADIVVLALVVVVNPAVQWLANTIQTGIIGNTSGSITMIAFGTVTQICSFPMSIVGLAVSVALVTCGMSIVYKRFRKELLK